MLDGTQVDPSQALLDQETIRRALAGDRPAADALATRLSVVHRILSALNSRAGTKLPPQELDDLGQDVLVLIWRKLRLFQGVGTLEAWLYRFCAYEFHNRRRRESLRSGQIKMLPDEPAAAREAPGEELDLEGLHAALRELGPPSEPVIRLKHEGGHSFEEVGRILGIPASTAKTRYYDGIRWLRQRLARRGGS